MSAETNGLAEQTGEPRTEATERRLLDQLLADARIYRQSKQYRGLLEFVVRFRNFAPFNAMLLQIQKPGLSYAASAHDWLTRFGRTVKEGARPLLILWPFGPVALVYDEMDTEGKELPRDVSAFFATGPIDDRQLASFRALMAAAGIEWVNIDAGDRKAGSIRVIARPPKPSGRTHYRMLVNRNHSSAVQFDTVAHELAHLFLGHLGADEGLSIAERRPAGNAQAELEAESVAYVVCARNRVTSVAETYLAAFVNKNTTIDDIDVYQILRAAGHVETLLGLTRPTKFR